MKAEILKLAGVKNEKEFYKKFPTEESFMAKYGKKLEKLKQAKVGDYISGGASQQFTPLSYSDVSDSVQSSLTGVSTAERNRQQDLAMKQAQVDATKEAGKSNGLMGLLSQNSEGIGKALSAVASGAKNGKRLKKADFGSFIPSDVPTDALNYMDNGSIPSDTNIDFSNSKSLAPKGLNTSNSSGAFKLPDLKNPTVQKGNWGKAKDVLTSAAPIIGNQLGSILGGLEQIDQEKKQIKELNKGVQVSGLVAQAAASRPEQQKRRYVRPEDSLVNPTQPKGSGTNYLAAENGAEIMNTYAPDVIYTDLGYEPLDDSNKVKAFKKGGKMKKADLGSFLSPLSGLGGQAGGWAASELQGGHRPGAGSQIGSSVGGAIGTAFGPLGTFIGSTLGGFAGGLIAGDGERQKQMQEAQDQITANTLNATGSAFAKNIQGANSSVMEEGGWISHDWQPQVIAKFGEYNVKDLLKPDPMMDTLRAGGHLKEYTPPSARAMYTGRDLPYQMEHGGQLAMGGDLEVYRGEAEPISTNPYLPNGGETVMFRGPSHDNGGMPISYGENGVEVEGGEPAMVMRDGGIQDNLVVFGNMHIPDYGAIEIGDPKAKGMKFKRYIADLSKQEDKQNKIMSKGTDLINSSNTDDPFDLLAFNSGKAMSLGANMKLKSLAEKKMNTAAVQNAILDTAEEHGLDSADLAKKNIAAFGGKFTSAPIAKNGTGLTKKGKALLAKKPVYGETSTRKFLPKDDLAIAKSAASNAQFALDPDTGKPYVAPEIGAATMFKQQLFPDLYAGPANANYTPPAKASTKDGTDWTKVAQMALTSASPFLRPRLSNAVDASQLYPEMLAASMNQLEPVPMQSYQPIIPSAPSRVSYQDQLNEITAQSRAAEKLAASNPSAAAALFSQVSQAKSKVLADQFRANQAQDQQYNEMRAQVLNDAQLKNLAMFDQQAVRQAEAKSKTKAQSIEIAKSISDKIAKNKLENKQLHVMENLYPAFSFTSEGTAYKNPLYQAIFNPSGIGSGKSGYGDLEEGKAFSYNKSGKIIGTHSVKKDEEGEARNGKIVKAFKNF